MGVEDGCDWVKIELLVISVVNHFIVVSILLLSSLGPVRFVLSGGHLFVAGGPGDDRCVVVVIY